MVAKNTVPPITTTTMCFHYICECFVVALAIFVSIMLALFVTPEDVIGRGALFAVGYTAQINSCKILTKKQMQIIQTSVSQGIEMYSYIKNKRCQGLWLPGVTDLNHFTHVDQ